MRRLVFVFALCGVLAAPAAVLAARATLGDGTLVIQNGQAPNGVAVVKLTITGSVIGQVEGVGKIVIDAGANGPSYDVTGAGNPQPFAKDPGGTAQQWGFIDNFKFRAVGGKFRILVYGSNINLVAIGTGTVSLTGMPDTPRGDGRYSLNDGGWRSLPGTPSDTITIGADD
jgi:hypothetical protein